MKNFILDPPVLMIKLRRKEGEKEGKKRRKKRKKEKGSEDLFTFVNFKEFYETFSQLHPLLQSPWIIPFGSSKRPFWGGFGFSGHRPEVTRGKKEEQREKREEESRRN